MGNCVVCGNPTGKNKYACCRDCWSKYRSHTRECVVCGKTFYAPPSSGNSTCSKECSTIRRKNVAASGALDIGLAKACEAFKKSPRLQRNENNMHAKTWAIQAPDGTIYKFRNLSNWIREHECLLDGTFRQAFNGISRIKYTMQGKRKFKSYQWKGWRLISWEEE